MSENPVGTIYQPGFRLTGEYDRNNGEGYGGELGYGQGVWGVAAGYYSRKCDRCEGRVAGALGVDISGLALGIRFEKDVQTLGVLINPQGTHRVGLMAEVNKRSSNTSNVTAYGGGYSYVDSSFTFSLDASSRTYEGNANDKRILITPGLMLRADIFQVSVNDKITLNRDKNDSSQRSGEDHDFWGGLGIGGESFHLAVYGNYVNEVALAASLFF